ncbi:MAG: FHA domain-containing protein [Chloroflexi bacterium]|nr:FHA domain-containing protein [Chloroflexota bacterium]
MIFYLKDHLEANMIECPNCGHSNIEGALTCEKCGFTLWGKPADSSHTERLEDQADEFSIKSGWGTATFENHNQIIIHIEERPDPIVALLSDEFTIGRMDKASGTAPDLDLGPFNAGERGVSRMHAVLRRGDDVVSIVDLDSSNGTYLNGQRLAAHQPRLLRDGDEIRVGRLVMHIYFK